MTEDRRRYFRFTVEVVLNFKILSVDSPSMMSWSVGDNGMERFHIDAALDSGPRGMANIASCLRNLDQRIDCLYDILVWKSLEENDGLVDNVCLSGMGVAFHVASPIAVGKKLELKMLLIKSQSGLVTTGKVVRCDLDPAGDPSRPYFAALEFENISQAHQDLLMRYVLQQQGRKLSNHQRHSNEN